MDNVFKFIADARKVFIELIDSLSVEELNQVPEGFNNNIIWNFGHIVVSTQTLCYVRTGVWPDTSAVKYVKAYEKGSSPSYQVDASEIQELKALALSSIDSIAADYEKGLFATAASFSTSTYYATLAGIDDVLITSIGHDNLHYGYALALRRAIKN